MMTSTPRNEWYQTDSHIIISVFYKNAKDVKVDFKPNSANLIFDGNSLTFNNLFGAIDVDKSTFQVFGTKIEIKLLKETPGRWDDLERKEVKQTLGYPSSSKSKKDWTKEIKPEEDKVEGDQALNKLFQDIFRDGSDDTKRAMMKSFQESGGTCLSTNWNEVGSKRVEVTPPEGMVAKKYGE